MSAFISTSSTPTGPAGGDLDGTYPNPSVDGLQTRPVDAAAPATNDVLTWDGAQWTPTAGTPAPVLWRWNETDASQFQVAIDNIAGGNAALSVVTNAYGPALRVTFPTKSSGLNVAIITIPDLVLTKNARGQYRYIFRFRAVTAPSALSEWYSAGVAFLCNNLTGPNFYGLAATAAAAGATRFIKAEAGAIALSGATPAWVPILSAGGFGGAANRITVFENNVVAKHEVASPPTFLNLCYAGAWGSSNATLVEGQNNAAYAATCSAFGAGWNTQTLDTVGIAFLGTAGATANQFWEFDEIEVVKDPMDL